MKCILLPLLILIIACTTTSASDDPYRTFTDEQGRSIRAVIIRTGPAEVWIRRKDGQTFRVPRSTFSERDREFIARWELLDALKAPNALEFSARRYSQGGREVQRTTSRENTSERFGYTITLKNNSPIDLGNLEIEYRYFVWEAKQLAQRGQNRELTSYSGRARIESLPSRGSTEFQTSTAVLRSIRLLPGWTNNATNRRRANDDLRGVWIKVRQNGELIAEFSSPDRLKETEAW